MKTLGWGVVESQFYTFFDLGAIWGEWSTPRPGRFNPPTPGSVHCVGESLGSRAGLERCGKFRLNRDTIVGPSRLPVVPVRVIRT